MIAATILVVVFLLFWKAIPLVFHLRIAKIILEGIIHKRKLKTITERVPFSERVLLNQMDFNMHMNNSSYYEVADLARIQWLARFLGGLSVARQYRIANGGVSLFFLRELTFLKQYELSISLRAIDSKWCYLFHEFRSGKTLHAVGFQRMVFKEKSGKTIPPATLLSSLGYESGALLLSGDEAAKAMETLVAQSVKIADHQ